MKYFESETPCIKCTVKPVHKDHPWAPKIGVQNGISKWWSLLAGGRYSEVVISSGLTVYIRYLTFLI